MSRLFRCAEEDGEIDPGTNPVKAVHTPEVNGEIKRPRVILSDDEFTRYITCPDVDLELRIMSLTAGAA